MPRGTRSFDGYLPPPFSDATDRLGGYDLEPRWLLSLFGPILGLAVVGTATSSFVVAVFVYLWASAASSEIVGRHVSFAECLTFGALVSAWTSTLQHHFNVRYFERFRRYGLSQLRDLDER